MGRFITFEGVEGSGKSTHIDLLATRLRERGYEVVTTREPGGTLLGEAIRGILQFNTANEPPRPSSELLLFCASRAQLVEQVLRPALKRGAWVISDRFSDSTFAYQGYGRGFDLTTLHHINHFATGGLDPDLTLLLEIDYPTSRERLRQRDGDSFLEDRFEREPDQFHLKVERGFKEIAHDEPQRIQVVDSNGAVAEIAERIWQIVQERFLKDQG